MSKHTEEPVAVEVPDIKLVIADYLELRDEAFGVDSTDEERTISATELHDAIQRIHAKLACRSVLNEVIDAWEALPAGLRRVTEVQEWLRDSMAPAINAARQYLGRPRPSERKGQPNGEATP